MANKRTLKPRVASKVVNRNLNLDSDSIKSYIPRGNYSFNPKVVSKLRLEKPKVYMKGGFCTFRIWNMVDPENPGSALLNGRLNQYDSAGLGGMAISEPVICADYVGISKNHTGYQADEYNPCTYIIARDTSSSYEGVPFWSLPYLRIYNVAAQAINTSKYGDTPQGWDAKWNFLFSGKGQQNKNPAIKSFDKKFFLFCSMYENGESFNLDKETIVYMKNGQEERRETERHGIPLGEAENDPLVILSVTATAGRDLLKICNAEIEEYEGGSDDPAAPFIIGDPCGTFNAKSSTVNGGVFFSLFNASKFGKSYDVIAEKARGKFLTHKIAPFELGDNKFGRSYDVGASDSYTYNGEKMSASLDSKQVNNVLDKSLYFWREDESDESDSFLFHEPGIEERCVMLAKAFKPIPKLLKFCWMSNPEYLEFDEVQSILNNRKVFVPSKAVEEDDEDEEPVVVKKSSVKKASKKKAADIIDSFEDEDDEDEVDVTNAADSFDVEDEDEDEVFSVAVSKKKSAIEEEDSDYVGNIGLGKNGYGDEVPNDEVSEGEEDSISSSLEEDFEEGEGEEESEDFSGADEPSEDEEEDAEAKMQKAMKNMKALEKSKKRRSTR